MKQRDIFLECAFGVDSGVMLERLCLSACTCSPDTRSLTALDGKYQCPDIGGLVQSRVERSSERCRNLDPRWRGHDSFDGVTELPALNNRACVRTLRHLSLSSGVGLAKVV
jgi:hypothetical protein